MIDKNNRRLLNDVEHLRGAYINPTDDEEICQTGKIFPIVLVRYCHKSIVSNNKDNIFLQGGMIMHYYQTIILKDGRSCTLRNGTSQDGRAVKAADPDPNSRNMDCYEYEDDSALLPLRNYLIFT